MSMLKRGSFAPESLSNPMNSWEILRGGEVKPTTQENTEEQVDTAKKEK